MDIDELLKINRKDVLRIASKYGARNVRIFGSVTRGEARADSDNDVLVEFASPHSLLDHIALMRDLKELLGRKIDVVTGKALHWYIRDGILKQAVPL